MNVTYGLAYLLSGVLMLLGCRCVTKNVSRLAEVTPKLRLQAYAAERLKLWAGLLTASGALALVFGLMAPEEGLLCGCLEWMPLMFALPIAQTALFGFGLSQGLINDDAGRRREVQ